MDDDLLKGESSAREGWRAKLPPEFTPFDESELQQPIVARFERMVARYPERMAVRAGAGSLTYAQLNARANRVADAIVATLGAEPEPVLVLCAQSAAFVTAAVGVLKAGKFYAPMTAAQPLATLKDTCADLQTRLVLCDDAHATIAQTLATEGVQLINIDRLDETQPAERARPTVGMRDLAYIVYTSGSSGKPKGVPTDQQAVLRYAYVFNRQLHLNPDDRVGCLNALTTNVAQGEVLIALTNGAALCPFDLRANGVGSIAAWLSAEQVTLYCSVPLIFRQFASLLQGDQLFPHLRVIRLGGDRMLPSDAELFQQHFSSNSLLRHGLGSSELMLVTQYFIDQQSVLPPGPVPLGFPLDDIELWILDDAHQRLPVGQSGEIAIRSRYHLSPGYWRRPELNAERFFEDPDGTRTWLTGDVGYLDTAGCLYHLGRKDFLVKVRGTLVAPLEVENALLAVSGIQEAFVTAHEAERGEVRLVAYVVPHAQPAPDATTLRAALAPMLSPEKMPAAFIALDKLPLNPHNKVDRAALPVPTFARPQLPTPYLAPRTPVETQVAALWAELLGIKAVGIRDPFLELGGDSLLAGRIAARVVEQLGVNVPLSVLLDAATVKQMSLVIVQSLVEKFHADELV